MILSERRRCRAGARPLWSEPGRPFVYSRARAAADAPALTSNLAAALAAADVAAVLVSMAASREAAPLEQVRAIGRVVHDRGIALLIEGDPASVEPAGADGAHVAGIAALDGALPLLKPRYIVGCGGLYSRHDAMIAGERGADYVMFGEPGPDGRRPAFVAVLDRVAWWAELFEVPCVGWAMNLDEVAALAGAGADFVGGGSAQLSYSRPHGAEILQWFDTSKFTKNAIGTFGNAGRNILRGPRFFNTDFGLVKGTSIHERVRLQFRAEFFNLFNDVNFMLPNANVSSVQVGQITSVIADSERIIQFGLKLVF